MKAIYRRLCKLEEGLGLVPETAADRRLRARIEAGRARLAAAGYPVSDTRQEVPSGRSLSETIVEILQRGRLRAAQREEIECPPIGTSR